MVMLVLVVPLVLEPPYIVHYGSLTQTLYFSVTTCTIRCVPYTESLPCTNCNVNNGFLCTLLL